MTLSSEELVILDRYHTVQGLTDAYIQHMPTREWDLTDALAERGLLELDLTFAKSSNMTYVQITEKGTKALFERRMELANREEDYRDQAIF